MPVSAAMWVRNYYAFAEIDRAGHLRRDEAWLAARVLDANSRFVPVWRAQNLVSVGGEGPRAAFLARDEIVADPTEFGTVLLGLDGEAALFALDLSAHDDP